MRSRYAQYAEQAFYVALLSGFLVMAGSFVTQVLSVHSAGGLEAATVAASQLSPGAAAS